MALHIFLRTAENAGAKEKEAFIRLVQSGEAVDGTFVRSGIERRGAKMVFATNGGELAGVAALKVPASSYRNGLARTAKAGYELPEQLFPFELGYVAVAPKYEGKGLGTRLVQEVVSSSAGKGLFATTSSPAMLEHILPKFGFTSAGSPWMSTRRSEPTASYKLHLLIRNATS